VRPRIRLPRLVSAVVREAGADQIGRLAAALAYFAIFAMPGLLVLAIGAASTVFGWNAVQSRVLSEAEGFVGAEGANTIREVIAASAQPKGSSLFAKILGSLALVFGATGFFLQLQDALNAMWGAKGNERRKGIGAMVRKRVLSLGMVLAIALLLLVSLALSAVFSAVGDRFAGWIAPGVSAGVLAAVQLVVTFVMTALLFAAVYKVMPDLRIEWREVWVGAAATAALFVAGKFAIGFYLGRSDPGSAYGAAGPLVVLLVWIYYSTLVVLVGAEFTQVYARLYGPRRNERARRMQSKAEHDERVSSAKGPQGRRKVG
jgi:membrane protein